MEYEKGKILEVYSDCQTNTNKIGIVRLKEPSQKSGYTFILKEGDRESSQLVYGIEYWYVDWIDNPTNRIEAKHIPIRYIKTVGSSSSEIDEDDNFLSQLPKDSFIQIHGIEIF